MNTRRVVKGVKITRNFARAAQLARKASLAAKLKRYRLRHPQKVREIARRWEEKNRARRCAIAREYYERNKADMQFKNLLYKRLLLVVAAEERRGRFE